jgi:Fe-S-cluster containining protein
MADKKFRGKIIGDPWEVLSKGPLEAMASLWEAYLTEVLGVSAKSGRLKVLRREIEEAAGYRDIAARWNSLPPQERAAAWRRLIGAAQERFKATQEICVRCGECCELGSPTLLTHDLPLFQQEILTWNDVYTLRRGDRVNDREGRATTLQEERLKVREVPGTRQCWFYQAATHLCRIYEKRPEQCRRQNCWGDPARPPAAAQLLSRRELLNAVPEVGELIAAHEARCDLKDVARTLEDLAAGRQEAGDALFEALHFDHYLREMLINDWGLTLSATELLLGRPLTQFLRAHGITATLTPEGTFRLEHRGD